MAAHLAFFPPLPQEFMLGDLDVLCGAEGLNFSAVDMRWCGMARR